MQTKGLLIIVYFLLALVLVNRLLLIFSANADMGGMEPGAVNFIIRLLQDGQLYCNPTEYPFISWPHTPLYYYLIAGLCNFLGSNLSSIYFIGRLVSLLANLATLWYVYKILQLYKVEQKIALLTLSIVFLSLSNLNMAVRADSLKTMFLIAALYYYLRFNIYNVKADLYLSAGLVAIAVFTKQDAAFLPIIITLYWLIKRNVTETFKYALPVFVGSLVLLISLVSYESYTIENIFYGMAEFTPGVFALYSFLFAIISKPVFIILLILLALLYKKRNNSDLLFFIAATYMVLSFGSLAKFGSDSVYLTDPLLICIAYIAINYKKLNSYIIYPAVALIFLLLTALYPLLYSPVAEKQYRAENEQYKNVANVLLADDIPQYPILSYNPNIYNYIPINRSIYGYLYNYADFAFVYYHFKFDKDVKLLYNNNAFWQYVKHKPYLLVLANSIQLNRLRIAKIATFTPYKAIGEYTIYIHKN